MPAEGLEIELIASLSYAVNEYSEKVRILEHEKDLLNRELALAQGKIVAHQESITNLQKEVENLVSSNDNPAPKKNAKPKKEKKSPPRMIEYVPAMVWRMPGDNDVVYKLNFIRDGIFTAVAIEKFVKDKRTGFLRVGWSFCNPIDSHDVYTGDKEALKKALFYTDRRGTVRPRFRDAHRLMKHFRECRYE